MKKNPVKFILLPILLIALTFASVLVYTNANTITASTKTVQDVKPKVTEYTLETLKQYNGKNGSKMLVAVNNVVYDVTKVAVFKTGTYKNMKAGTDITTQLAKIKNGKDILKKAVKVGVLVKSEKKGQSATTANQPKTNTTNPPKSNTEPKVSEPVVKELRLTLEELSKFNGQNGQPAYIAVDGIIYDVTNIPKWKGGVHQNLHTAGNDLSKAILDSPHGKSMLKDVPIVGRLK